MAERIEYGDTSDDYYAASLENGSLVMVPHCACGNTLSEDYFCNQCVKRCHCRIVICQDKTTLETVNRYIEKSSKFSGLKATLAEKS